MSQQTKALVRLREMHSFSPEYETFESLFWDQLDRSRVDEAVSLLLQVVYALLSGDGERFEQLLSRADAQTATKLRAWLDAQLEIRR